VAGKRRVKNVNASKIYSKHKKNDNTEQTGKQGMGRNYLHN